MPPKLKTTRDDIINAAVEIVRIGGTHAINARTIASMLRCSTQPIFSNFSSMDELRMAVIKKAEALCHESMLHETRQGNYPPNKAYSMAYIRFAKEEKELFKLLYMRDRTGETNSEDSEIARQMGAMIQKSTGLEGDSLSIFHLEMWAFVHGIATMLATGYLDLEWELISKMITDAYFGLRKQYGLE